MKIVNWRVLRRKQLDRIFREMMDRILWEENEQKARADFVATSRLGFKCRFFPLPGLMAVTTMIAPGVSTTTYWHDYAGWGDARIDDPLISECFEVRTTRRAFGHKV